MTRTPQRTASASAAASAAPPISSAMMTSGAAARSIRGIAAALGQPSITSVRGPTSSVGTPR